MKIERFLYVFLGFGGKKWLPCHFYHWSFYVEKTPVKLGNSGIHAAFDTLMIGRNV